MNLKNLTDKELVLKSKKNGSFNQIYSVLYSRHKNKIHNFLYPYVINKEDKEDIVQDSLIKIFLNLNQYDPHRVNFKTWMFTIVKNTAIDSMRKNQREGNRVDKSKDIFEMTNLNKSPYPNPEEISIRNNIYQIVNNSIDNLPRIYRGVLKNYFFKQATYSDLEKKFNLSSSSIKSRIHNGRKILQNMRVLENTLLPSSLSN